MSLWSWLLGRAQAPADPLEVPVGKDIELPSANTTRPVSANTATTPSSSCIALIEREEGCALKAYQDVDGSWVIGYGCKLFDGKPVVSGQTCDAAGADRNCRAHAQLCANAILGLRDGRWITQGQLDALTDFVYNIGIGALQQSTLLKTFNAGQTVTQSMFTVWNKIHKDGQLVELPALTLRRTAEYQLFIS